ncbi:hypothetical protein CAC42_3736 [Sphaceloma murrayae]|uniref:U4/U6.U5 small nuclear ribonucleoprotein 27kDa protein domain-containing protein n=1 Tax=Sphaceloma murrayae TaxID=2082308 RepID=A0A2K1QHR6_9PEZI|nr:hypothetical protein CAC42_3736 [Sphaceloma murrayae]
MAPSREEASPADRHDDRRRERGGRFDDDRRDYGRNSRGPNDVVEDDGLQDQKRGQKRKSYDPRGNDDRSKRQRTRSISPDWSEKRKGPSHRNREPPKGPRGQMNGVGGHGGRRGGPPSGPRGHDRDDMDVDRPHKRNQRDDDPIKRMTAAWIPDIKVAEDDELLQEVKQTMGFAGFKSSKNRKVPGNNKNYGVKKEKQTQYRQYMNRVGGFNRPLSPSRE